MVKIQKDVNLRSYNTFGVSARAGEFAIISSIKDLNNLNPNLVLGGGANILITHDFPGLVVKNEIKGKKIISQTADELTVEVASGENWHDFVMATTKAGWSGLENLALIPGTVGGALIGNIGAYGQTFENIFVSAKSGKEIFSKEQCKFGYRESAFKHELKNFFVETVTIKLSKNPDAQRIAKETIALRKEKLPDWTVLGTAGSFFKNPFITSEKLKELQKEFPDIPNFPNSLNPKNFPIKIPAGFLLDKLGWRGKRIGRVGTFPRHALIIINYGGATGEEILAFSRLMQADLKSHYAIDLEPEVNII